MRIFVIVAMLIASMLFAKDAFAQQFERGPVRRSWSCAVQGVLAGVATYNQCAAREGLRARGRWIERRRCYRACRNAYPGFRNRALRRDCRRSCRRLGRGGGG